MKQSLPFGMWKGKISADLVAERTRINSLKWDGDDLVFNVSKGGKSYLYRKSPNMPWVQINGDYPVYGGVGYGGGDFDALGGKTLFCAGKHGLRLHEAGKNGSRGITQDTLDHASPVIHPGGKYAAYVCSDGEHDQIALIALGGYDWPKRLVCGADFYMQPEWSPDGKHLAWAQWDHPNMPWSGASVWMASFNEEGACIGEPRKISGGADFPASQPHFSPDGKSLIFIETRENWDDLVCLDLLSGFRRVLVHGEGFCLADPAFVQGICSCAWLPDSAGLVYTRVIGTRNELYHLRLSDGKETKISEDRWTVYNQICVSPKGDVAAVAAGPLDFEKVVLLRNGVWETLWQSADMVLDASFVSLPKEISWKAADGTEVFALYYPPCNPDYEWHGAPPAILQIHGGPTGQADQGFSAETAYFTSLGYAYVRVNYRGSSGFGRKYIECLNGHWGDYDTDDAADCVKYLSEQGLADGKRVLITGGSSGGYAVLNALVRYPDVFAAGASLYGVSDLYGLVSDTHKLELHYTDTLVGTLPEADEKYRAWSPMFHMEHIRVPLAIFQGDSDRVVPPDQSKGLLSGLKVPYVFRLYEGEGHGFRQPEHIRDYLETLHDFLKKYL